MPFCATWREAMLAAGSDPDAFNGTRNFGSVLHKCIGSAGDLLNLYYYHPADPKCSTEPMFDRVLMSTGYAAHAPHPHACTRIARH